MDISKLAKADLNLLVALHVLIEERSVSKAANRCLLYTSDAADE